MAIKYLDINQESNLIPVTEEGNFIETVKNKIISIIEKIEQFIDKILFKLREEGLVIEKHRQALIKHASEVNDIEMDLLKIEPEKIAELGTCLPDDNSNIDDINRVIEYMKKYDADFISKNTVKTTIGECNGGVIGLIRLTDSMGKYYLKFKSELREKKRRIKGQHKEISKEVYSTLIQMYNLYGSTISRLCLTQYRNFHAAITKATNKTKTLKEFAACGICDEFNAFMESNFGLNEGTATDYKTVDISDCGGVDITDTIDGNFDNWEGIIPDNTIGDITAEFDDFLESTFDSMDFDNDAAINEQFDQMIDRVMLESDSSSKVSKLKSELEKTCVGKTEHQIDAILYKYYKLCRGKAVAAIIGGSASAGAVVGAIAGGITAGGAGAAAGAAGGAMFGGVAGCYVYIFIASYYIGKLNKFNIPLLKKRRRIEKIIYDTEDLLEKARDKNKTKEAKELESLLRKERRELDRLQRITSDKVQKVNSAGAYSESTGLPNITAEFDSFLEATFGATTPTDLIEGSYEDKKISQMSHKKYSSDEDIAELYDSIADLEHAIKATKFLLKAYKSGKAKQSDSKFMISMYKTKYTYEQLQEKLSKLQKRYSEAKAAYEKAGGDTAYYMQQAAKIIIRTKA